MKIQDGGVRLIVLDDFMLQFIAEFNKNENKFTLDHYSHSYSSFPVVPDAIHHIIFKKRIH